MNRLTVAPLLVALIVGIAMQALHLYDVHARQLGTEKGEPWRERSNGLIARVRSVLSWLAFAWRSRAVRLTAAAALALLVAQVHGADASALPLIGVAGIAAEPSLADVKKAIDESNRAWNEFKETNDARIKALEAGKAVDPLITEKLDKLNEAIDAHSKMNEALIAKQTAQEAVLNRLSIGGGGSGNADEVKRAGAFNLALKAHAKANQKDAPKDLTIDEVRAYGEAYEVYLRRGDRVLTPDQVRALSVGTDPNGGWMVHPDLSGRMVERVFETSPMRQYSSVQAIGTDALEGSADLEEASAGWTGETSTRSETNTPNTPAPWRIPVHEAYAAPRATQKMVEDGNINVVAWLGKKVGDKIGRLYNTAFVTGNGVAKPRGVASYTSAATADGSRAWGVFEHVATGSNGSFGTDPNGINKLLDLIHAMKDVYAAKGAFYWNRTTLGKARQLTDASSAGKYVFIPSFQAGQPDQFLGYPSRKLQDMATYSTTDALAIAFGDMEETYQIVDRLNITVLVDPYTAKPYIVYYTRGRVGGDVINFESLKFLKFGS